MLTFRQKLRAFARDAGSALCLWPRQKPAAPVYSFATTPCPACGMPVVHFTDIKAVCGCGAVVFVPARAGAGEDKA